MNYPSSDAESNNSYSGNYSVNANWTLFDGGQRNKAIKQQKLQNEVDKLSTEQSEDDIQIAIVQTYLQVMYAMEAVEINENTVETSKAERDRAEELYKAGSISAVIKLAQFLPLIWLSWKVSTAQTNINWWLLKRIWIIINYN